MVFHSRWLSDCFLHVQSSEDTKHDRSPATLHSSYFFVGKKPCQLGCFGARTSLFGVFEVYLPFSFYLIPCLGLCTESPLISLAQRNPFPAGARRFYMELVLQYFPATFQHHWKRCTRFLPAHIKIIHSSVHESASCTER